MEPWGEERADLRSGIIAATIANSAPYRKRGRAFQPSEFMPVIGKGSVQRQSDKEIDARLMAFVTAHNAALKGN